ncbi:hypothetical protein K458DRAFT_411288 [Lentithecium fluviatile CBS 122367]|uniref:Gcp-like domain-containing protein n=1 Tax=Lentithecium fluviatile CBS 122367 TaxID=1168545 RepID=A0A6G1JM98_9PLEO|nr:hypothetical protein K458DRAFT_411288 [Lentithecium fluviatile CBS 122367]
MLPIQRLAAGVRARPVALHGPRRPRLPSSLPSHLRPLPHPRLLLTLAIETSCDDTSVAVLEKTTCASTHRTVAKLHFHKTITANNAAFKGVHPLVTLESHQENLAKLVAEAIEHLPLSKLGKAVDSLELSDVELGRDIHHEVSFTHSIYRRQLPDLISVTRGPGMRSNLSTGLDTAKGLAVAWGKPLQAVHHMQAHALTPRLADALETYEPTMPLTTRWWEYPISVEPDFPFLSVLASGGHTLLVHSASLTDHEVMGSTSDIAIGECLDKIARIVLPEDVLRKAGNIMYGALLESFAFPPQETTEEGPTKPKFGLEKSTATEYRGKYAARYTYNVPKNHEEALKRNVSKWGWGFNQPLCRAQGGLKSKSMEMSFSGLMTAVERVVKYELDPRSHKLTQIERPPEGISTEERKDLAHHAMRAAFEHLAGRVVLGLQHSPSTTVVMAGGVAANSYLRYIVACTLCAHGYDSVKIVFPPPSLCCDNAAMIAWAGVEMYENGARDDLDIRAVRKWPLGKLLSPPLDKTSESTPPTESAS